MNEGLIDNLNRYHRRHLIEEQLDKGETSQTAIKESVKQQELANQDELEKLYDDILHKEAILYPETVQVATELQTHLQSQFPDYTIAIILVGSSVTGGLQLRKLFLKHLTPGEEITHEPDFDMVLGVQHKDSYENDGGIDLRDLEDMDQATSDFLDAKGIQLCANLRPKKYAIQPLSPHLPLQEQEELVSEELHSVTETFSVFSFLFAPSIPPEFNERNRNVFVKLLSKLYKEDSDEWNRICTYLIDELRAIHKLKKKYFSQRAISKPDFDESAEKFTEARMKVFKDLLKSTADEMGAMYIDFM